MSEVRAFFEETLPGLLDAAPPRFDSARYRVYIPREGAWEIDMRGARPRVRSLPEDIERGGAVAAVVLSAAAFAQLRTTGIAPRAGLRPEMKLRVVGDGPRALAMLGAIVAAPPLEWPSSVRVHALPSAFFRATPDSLAGAFPGWRAPLATHRMWVPKNPLTGKPLSKSPLDPGGGEPTFAPLEPPLPYVPFQSRYRWKDLLSFYTWLVPNDADVVDDLLAEGTGSPGAAAERFFPDALFGPRSIHVRAVPPLFAPAMAAVRPDELRAGKTKRADAGDAPRFRVGSPLHHTHVRWLRPLRELARTALDRNERLWFWASLER